MKEPEKLRPDDPNQAVVLIAEDDVMVLNLVRITLERDGYFILTAENGEEAVLVSRNYAGEIHILLTDVCMPRMTGLQAAKRIRAERPGICVLVMSGTFDEENPGYPCVRKPFSSTQLSKTIQGLLPACIKRAESRRIGD